ncbi:F-box domain containing protein [Tanacetum coccineum]
MENGKVIKLDTTDRISQLPESILHHILAISYSDYPKLLVRMSVLSKYWFSLTASFPILDFDIGKFDTAINGPWSTLSSEVYVVDKFFRYVNYTTSRYCQQNLNAHTFKLYTCIQDATQANVVDKCLALILMEGIKVLINIIECPLVPSDNSAKTLYRLPNILLLAASSLTSLKVCNCDLPLSFMVDIVTFKSLKLLHLYRIRVDEKVIKCLTISCPILEELNVIYCYGIKTFWVYGLQNLQKVCFYYHSGVEIVDIKVPNLCCLSIIDSNGMGAPGYRLESDSLESKPRMECYPENDVDTLWIHELRRFLDKGYGFRVLKLQFTSTNITDIEELKVLQRPPYELEHVELELHSIKDISLCSYYGCSTLHTYEKLLQQEDQGPTNIQIVLLSASFKATKRFSNLNSLLAALPRRDRSQTITFTKEKVVQGNKEE